MKNISEYNHLIEKEMEKFKKESARILKKFEAIFNKGNMVATHHFTNANPDMIRLVKKELEKAGFVPEFTGNRPEGHIVLRVSLLKSAGYVA
ncbi:hypothetical protein [Marinifilum sp.]|uniref:hypothetical protein n=1 Tax=Marinifilum sp. TaxID=2033137 RepID=UPI003BAD3636